MWNQPPSYDEVRDAIRNSAYAKARLRLAEEELELLEARVSKDKPRTAWAKVIGIDEQTEAALSHARQHVLQAKNDLDECEAQVKFMDYHKEMFKAIAFRDRI